MTDTSIVSHFKRASSINDESLYFFMIKEKKLVKRKLIIISGIIVVLISIILVMRTQNKPKIIAHRGASGYKTEHTFQAYDLAKKDTTFLEQDVVLSKDGTLYVSHDQTPYRLTKREQRPFSELSDKEINHLRTNQTKSSQSEPIHTLQSVVNRYKKEVTYVVELKDNKLETVQTMCRFIQKNQLQNHIIIQSFNLNALKLMKEDFPNIPMMYLVKDERNFQLGLDNQYVDILAPNIALLSNERVKAVHRQNKEFCVWTANTAEEIKRATQYKVDYLFTNYPNKA